MDERWERKARPSKNMHDYGKLRAQLREKEGTDGKGKRREWDL